MPYWKKHKGFWKQRRAPALPVLCVRSIKEGFWEETRHRARKWHLWPKAVGTAEEGACVRA